jgi:predicted DNA-binding protein (MmcQ/YjbR family)
VIERIERIALGLPEAERVDIAAWDDQPTFRVRGKNFVFTDAAGTRLTLKLPPEEAEWVARTVHDAHPTRYGLGRHGWVTMPSPRDEQGWQQVAEWIRESYRQVAPKRLVAALDDTG